MTGAAAFVRGERLDVLAENRLSRALYSEMYVAGIRPANMARFVCGDNVVERNRRIETPSYTRGPHRWSQQRPPRCVSGRRRRGR